MADEIATRNDAPVRNRVSKLSAEKALPSVGAEQLARIIKGYAVASNGGQDQVNYKDVASATGLNPTVVSANNSFLTESGVITSPKYGFYVPCEEAVRFARESAWDEENAKSHLRKIVLATWYGQVTVQNFVTRSTLSEEELRRVLAIKCGATESDTKALNYIIDFLVYLGVVSEGDDGSLRRGNTDELSKQTAAQGTVPDVVLSAPAQSPNGNLSVTRDSIRERANAHSGVSIALNLNLSIDELTPENAQRVRDWVALLNQQDDA
jgi:hypothetical protein